MLCNFGLCVILYAPLISWMRILASFCLPAFVRIQTSDMSKLSQKTKSKTEMCNNLVYVYACAAPNISILNIFGMVITLYLWLSRHIQFASLVLRQKIASSCTLKFHMQFLFVVKDRLQSNGFFNIVALSPLLTLIQPKLGNLFHVMQQRTFTHTHTHTNKGIQSVCNECYGMTLHYAHWCYCSHDENYNVDLFPSLNHQLKFSNCVWFDT